jgi:hypothetical protein
LSKDPYPLNNITKNIKSLIDILFYLLIDCFNFHVILLSFNSSSKDRCKLYKILDNLMDYQTTMKTTTTTKPLIPNKNNNENLKKKAFIHLPFCSLSKATILSAQKYLFSTYVA